ncbi:neurofilament medium polypeptide-like [Salvia splendens]|uniref:neurofilament medium polypeptide-like n=1 Tax=Salvia splendens TaxID=180675 RepID=UPI001C27884C|nr:neurofilament medium polypeptide-like [Salvia splendens]
MAITLVKEFLSSVTFVDEADSQEEDRDQDIHGKKSPDVADEPEQEMVESDKGNETEAESGGNEEAEEECEEEVEGQAEVVEEGEEDEEGSEEKVEEPKSDDNPVGKKETQRQGQVEEVMVATKPRKLRSDPKASEHTTKPIKVPFPHEAEEDAREEDRDSEEGSAEEPIYSPEEVVVTKKLLGEMAYFSDPKKARTYAERGTKGKQAKSGKSYHPESFQEIESKEEFLSYINAIGFEWLLSHSTVEVPVTLAKEFLTSFNFKSTTDAAGMGAHHSQALGAFQDQHIKGSPHHQPPPPLCPDIHRL